MVKKIISASFILLELAIFAGMFFLGLQFSYSPGTSVSNEDITTLYYFVSEGNIVLFYHSLVLAGFAVVSLISYVFRIISYFSEKKPPRVFNIILSILAILSLAVANYMMYEEFVSYAFIPYYIFMGASAAFAGLRIASLFLISKNKKK